jgi:hypothetical protein
MPSSSKFASTATHALVASTVVEPSVVAPCFTTASAPGTKPASSTWFMHSVTGEAKMTVGSGFGTATTGTPTFDGSLCCPLRVCWAKTSWPTESDWNSGTITEPSAPAIYVPTCWAPGATTTVTIAPESTPDTATWVVLGTIGPCTVGARGGAIEPPCRPV